ncbi:MAG: hypothetical protein IJZ91_05640 [Oscillospiraceae bacterium]|nr:hypothetical protein [Oscillospiraceae bacterium]
MAEKKFTGINGTVIDALVEADFEQAPQFDKVKVGKLGVYFKDGFKTRYLEYGLIERAFIRVQEVNGKLCCGNTILQYFRLVFVKDGKEFVDVISENEKAMDEALALIAANAPSVKIGFERKEG